MISHPRTINKHAEINTVLLGRGKNRTPLDEDEDEPPMQRFYLEISVGKQSKRKESGARRFHTSDRNITKSRDRRKGVR